MTCGMVTASLIQVDDTRGYVTLALLVALLAGLAAGVNRVSGLGHGRDDLVAALRATVQLAVVGLVIAVVLQSWWLTTLFVAVMVSVASVTAGRRLARGRRWVLAAIPVCVFLGVEAFYASAVPRPGPVAEQGRYIFPAAVSLASIATFACFAFGRRHAPVLATVFAVALIGLSLYARVLELSGFYS